MCKWGGGSIREPDWDVIKEAIIKYKVKSVVEFGPGLSTVLMTPLVNTIVGFETNQDYIDRLLAELPDANVRLWDGKDAEVPEADMVFVDGPAGGQNREHSFRLAAASADLVIVHDAGREWEQAWAERYLQGYDRVMGNGVTKVWERRKMSREVKIRVSEDMAKKLAAAQGSGRWFMAISYLEPGNEGEKRISKYQTRLFPHADLIPALSDWEKMVRKKEGKNISGVVQIPEGKKEDWK